jgi:hypothetical protein
VVAIGLWWNCNTIAHNFIHRPFFRAAGWNRAFSAFLSLLLGIPQTLWRDRHLAHHADTKWRLRVSPQLAAESVLIIAMWATLAWLNPTFFTWAYLPGYFTGLALCGLQGYWEHFAGPAVSHYGPIYNFLCMNDGYHAEHHANPGLHWTRLPERIDPTASTSRWPALLRWLELSPLELLELGVLRSRLLQRVVLRAHRDAFRRLLKETPNVRNIAIVGGGLYPRTALVLRELLPDASLTIIDSNLHNIEIARPLLGSGVTFRHERFESGDAAAYDLTVIPLCLQGDRAAIYDRPPSPAVLVHDWIWSRRGASAVISPLLLKRLNLVRQ